jgi:hypothetical protein
MAYGVHAAGRHGRIWLVTTLFLIQGAVGRVWGDGLEGEYLLSQRWRVLAARFSPLSNPALLTEYNAIDVHASLANTLGEFSLFELSIAQPLGLYQSLAVSWFFQGTEAFPATTGDFEEGPQSIGDVHHALVLSYAINPWNRLSVGVNATVVYRNLYGEVRQGGFGMDAGVSYRVMRDARLGDHVAGVGVQNLLPVRLSAENGPDENYPVAVRFSFLSEYLENRLHSSITVALKDILARKVLFSNAKRDVDWELDALVSYWMAGLFKLYGLGGFDGDGFKYWGIAPALNLAGLFLGNELEIAYQFIAQNDNSAQRALRAYTNSVYVHVELGKQREERYAKKMAHLTTILPNELYNRALRLYYEGRYWDAYFVLARIRVEYPDFFKNDWVSYYMASSQEEMDMRSAALESFDKLGARALNSAVQPYATLAKMRIHYRSGEDSALPGLFDALNQPGMSDSLRFCAHYLMGQSKLRLGAYAEALTHLEEIPPKHPDYLYAQHSLGVLKLLGDSITAALPHFQGIVEAVPQTRMQVELVNRTLVMMGYVYYEHYQQFEGNFSKAVSALRMVDPHSYYYEEALLGLGWIALKAQQWMDCMHVGEALEVTSQRIALQSEGALLRAYAFMMQQEYAQSIPILENALVRLSGVVQVDADSLQRRRQRYEGQRLVYQQLSQSAAKLASSRQSLLAIQHIDSLRIHQNSLESELGGDLKFFDEHKRTLLFARSVERVKQDIEYALARSQKMHTIRNVQRENQKLLERQQKLDDEIKNLEDQLQRIDINSIDSTKP